jgi:hypothetical protein
MFPMRLVVTKVVVLEGFLAPATLETRLVVLQPPASPHDPVEIQETILLVMAVMEANKVATEGHEKQDFYL